MVLTAPVTAVSLPPQLDRLSDLAYNLWWTWHLPARELFRELHPTLWERTEHNPVLFLHRTSRERLDAAAADPAYMRTYEATLASLDAMLAGGQETWIAQHRPELAEKTVAYLSAEFGLHRSLPIYSGGLGVLAGDHAKEASDLGLPMVGVSLLYRQGYLRQRLGGDGWQHDVAGDLDPHAEPTKQICDDNGEPLLIEVPLNLDYGPLRLAVWKVEVGRVPIYLLDSDVEGNPDWTRTISSRLYGGDREHRLRQEIILGIGGVRVLRAMGIKPAYWHANEGHAALHLLERVREYVGAGLPFDEAAERVRRTTVFTTHTPVADGHDVFSPALIEHYLGTYWPTLGVDRAAFFNLGAHSGSGDGFNLTALSLRLAGNRNAVSERHGEITRGMWHDIWPGIDPALAPITSITNGIHLPTWMSPAIARLVDQALGPDWRERQDDRASWDRVRDIPDEAFWQVHLDAKQELIDVLDERSRQRWAAGGFDAWQVLSSGPFLNRNVFTLGFARRFAMYKRATLLLRDIDRLAAILNHPERPVQIVFAGKAHPADDGGKLLIQEIYMRARDSRLGGRVVFAEDYDMALAGHLVAGVDAWLNNPRAPLEASGTSGMKAAVNGVPNLSILDGWWIEGWQPDNSNGWGLQPAPYEGGQRDEAEAEAIYRILEETVVPLYYQRDPDGLPREWIRVAKESMRTVAPVFSARRMLIEYVNRLYTPAAGANEQSLPAHRS